MRGPVWKPIGLAALCLVAAILFAWSAAGQQLDLWTYDFFLRLRPPQPQPASAIIVALDEPTMRANGGMAHLRRPLAAVLRVVAGSGAKVVAVDIQLPDRDDPQLDASLSDALDSTPHLVMATNLVADPKAQKVYWEDPLPEFSRRAALGHVHAEPDLDGVSRLVLLEKAGGGKRRWALALEAFRLASGAPNIVESEDTLDVGDVSIPASRREQRALRIRYLPNGALERVSASELMAHAEMASRLRDRAVFVGVTVQGADRLVTPYSLQEAGAMPGVEIHANLYETLARRSFLVTVPNYVMVVLAAAIAAGMVFCFHLLSGWRAFGCGFALLMLAHLFPYMLFTRNLVAPVSPAAATAWFGFLGLGTRHYLITRRRLGMAEAQRDRYQQAVHYVTHEMRTPLTAIQGSSELMGRYALSEDKRKEIAGLINRESRRLARMVEMFLSVERLSAGQLELKREAVPGPELLAACLERARPLAERKQIRLTMPSQEAASPGTAEETCIWGDREFLDYACYNLISNAIKYSPASTEIIVSADRAGETVRVSVRDQGYGMDEQEIRRVFQKFYRTRRAQESGEAGVGIGLALVEEIVTGHGGSIEVESRVNQGSCFTLVLPRATARIAQIAR